ncbi:hypothetical protein M9Y10_003272 [Tritrichomonas musculus]|uniref:Uncharacterized protein n=1 Tax=Tritrichomonas musculus TaxID=1915356 RepID=A0ABR2JQU1_9EUKA
MCLSARNQIIYCAIFYHLDFANYSFKWKFKVTTSVFVKQKASKQYAKAVSVVYFKILITIIRACTGAGLGAERYSVNFLCTSLTSCIYGGYLYSDAVPFLKTMGMNFKPPEYEKYFYLILFCLFLNSF